MRKLIIFTFLLCSLSAFAQPTIWGGAKFPVFQGDTVFMPNMAGVKDFVLPYAGDLKNGGNTTGATVVIGTNDANALNLETNNVARVAITGGASTGGAVTLTDVTSNTSTVENALTIQTNSSGTAAAGFGGGILFQGESSTTNSQDMAAIKPLWTTATHASRASALTFSTLTGAGSLTERMRILGTGYTGINNTAPASLLSVGPNITGVTDNAITVSGTGSNGGTISMQNTSSNGYTGVNIYGHTNLLSASFQFGNSSTTDGLANAFFFGNRLASGPFHIVSGVSANIRATMLTDGSFGFGTSSPTARLHIAAGTATANTAPLKLTSGTNLTTPENGAVEYDGTQYYVTSGGTRYTLAKVLTGSATLNFGSVAAGAIEDLTMTVTGAAAGDVVAIGLDGSTVSVTKGVFSAWVSAADTVTIRFANNDLANPINPTSATFKVTVTK